MTTAAVTAVVALALPAQAGFASDAPTTVQVSVDAAGGQSTKASFPGRLSADGRLSVLEVIGDDMVPGDSNNKADIVLHDELTGANTRVSTAVDGQQPNNHARSPVISADGKWIAYDSSASNVVPGDTNNIATDVFLYEVATGVTIRISVTSKGEEGKFGGSHPSISADGRYIAFESASHLGGPGADLNGAEDAFVHDRVKKTTIRASISSANVGANKLVKDVQISGDGRTVAFATKSSTLVPGDTNGLIDVFVRNLATKTTTMVSTTPSGAAGNGISYWPFLDSTGRHLLFSSKASDLLPGDTNGSGDDAFLVDLVTGVRTRLPNGNGRIWGSSISADGQVVGFSSDASDLVAGDTNAKSDGFVYNAGTGAVERVTLGVDGAQLDSYSGGPIVSPDGRSAMFATDATNVVPANPIGRYNVYVRHFG